MRMLSDVTGAGPALVLIPGGLTGWLSWVPFAEHWSADRRVVRLQLLSVQFGDESRPLPDDYSPKMESEALAATLPAVGLEPPVDFIAWSYGAAVTLDFMLRHQDWVRSVTLIEPPAFWVLDALGPDDDVGLRLNRDHISESDLAGFLRGAGFLPDGGDPRDLPNWPLWTRHRQSLRANPSILDYRGDRDAIGSFAPPVLLIKGTGSTPVMHHVIDALADKLPNAEVAEWPGGHAPHIVSRDAFLERVGAVLAPAG